MAQKLTRQSPNQQMSRVNKAPSLNCSSQEVVDCSRRAVLMLFSQTRLVWTFQESKTTKWTNIITRFVVVSFLYRGGIGKCLFANISEPASKFSMELQSWHAVARLTLFLIHGLQKGTLLLLLLLLLVYVCMFSGLTYGFKSDRKKYFLPYFTQITIHHILLFSGLIQHRRSR